MPDELKSKIYKRYWDCLFIHIALMTDFNVYTCTYTHTEFIISLENLNNISSKALLNTIFIQNLQIYKYCTNLQLINIQLFTFKYRFLKPLIFNMENKNMIIIKLYK